MCHHFFRCVPLISRIHFRAGCFIKFKFCRLHLSNTVPGISTLAHFTAALYDSMSIFCLDPTIQSESDFTAVKRESQMSWAPVYAFVKRIPRGRVITYGGLAKALRLRGGARSAGRAMAASPSGRGVPWHRVVGYGGKLLIREPYASLQRKLLESEGVTLLESRVDMKKHAWTPEKSLRKPKKSRRPRPS